MSFLFPSAPKVQPLPPPPPMPDQSSAEIERARRRQRLLQSQRKGRSSTILHGGRGLTGEAPIARKTLLGQ